jgi:hypothetical protein
MGHAAASVYPSKNLGAFGDAGAVLTGDDALAARLRSLRNYGQSRRDHADLPGINSRLDELQAAILRAKLRHLDAWTARRERLAAIYGEALRDRGRGALASWPENATSTTCAILSDRATRARGSRPGRGDDHYRNRHRSPPRGLPGTPRRCHTEAWAADSEPPDVLASDDRAPRVEAVRAFYRT